MTTSPRPKIEGYFLVRDRHGRPKVDDLASLPEPIKAMLTPEDWEYLRGLKNANT